jgi:hypothetical protein
MRPSEVHSEKTSDQALVWLPWDTAHKYFSLSNRISNLELFSNDCLE